MKEIRQYSVSELETLGRKKGGTGKTCYIIGDLVYKTNYEDYYKNNSSDEAEEDFLKKILECQYIDDVLEYDGEITQLHFELWTWFHISDHYKEFLCPILDYYIKDGRLIYVMPKVEVLSEMEDFYTMGDDSIFDFVPEGFSLEEELYEFTCILEDLHEEWGLDKMETSLAFNIGVIEDRVVSIDYGM